jgi:hypothetical protein
MDHAPTPLLTVIAHWPEPARAALWTCRALYHTVAAESGAGPLDESLKWGQPAWRPRQPRRGTTLRLDWKPDRSGELLVQVDCKTDLAARFRTQAPQIANDGRRVIGLPLDVALPEAAVARLAVMTFNYHQFKTAP